MRPNSGILAATRSELRLTASRGPDNPAAFPVAIGRRRNQYDFPAPHVATVSGLKRSEEHNAELQSLMRISYAVFCLKKKKHNIKLHIIKSSHTTLHTINMFTDTIYTTHQP